MFIVIIAFTISWVPLAINITFELLTPQHSLSECEAKSTQTEIINNLCYWAIHFNSAMNPLIYTLRIVDVQKTLRKLLGMNDNGNNSTIKSSEAKSRDVVYFTRTTAAE